MDFLNEYHLSGLVIGICTFLIIGIFHPIVVKAEYGNFKANASNGVSTTINSTGSSSSNSDKLELTLNDNTTNYNKGSYNDTGIKVTFEGEDVTSSSLITYKLNGTTKLTVNDLEDAINNLESGEEATITYSVVYKLKYKNNILHVPDNLSAF